MRILLVDDDVELALMLKDYFLKEDFQVDIVEDGLSAVTEALSGDYAIVVLDIMLPGINGLFTLKKIRQASQVPILMLTAKGDDADRILGLELGADDYVPKPCTPRELTARIRAILKRTCQPPSGRLQETPLASGHLTVWPQRRKVEWNGHVVALTSTEYNLLEVLVKNAGHAVSKNELSEQGLGRPLAPFDRNIDVHMSSLRRKLGVLDDGRSVLGTVYRLGYQLMTD